MASKDRDMESFKRDIQSLEASVSRLGKEKKLLKDRLVDSEEQSQAANDKMGQMARAKNKMEELLDEMEYDEGAKVKIWERIYCNASVRKTV